MGHPLIIGEHCRIQDVFRGNQISDFLTIGAASFGQIPYNAPSSACMGIVCRNIDKHMRPLYVLCMHVQKITCLLAKNYRYDQRKYVSVIFGLIK